MTPRWYTTDPRTLGSTWRNKTMESNERDMLGMYHGAGICLHAHGGYVTQDIELQGAVMKLP